MTRIRSSSLLGGSSVVVAVAAVLVLAASGAASSTCPIVTEVQFNQIEWFGTRAPLIEHSEWGEFSAEIAPTAIVQYVNVLANADGGDVWVVRNLPTLPTSVEPAKQRFATVFDLRLLGITRGTALDTLEYLFTLDATPRTSPPASGPMETARVEPARRDAEGLAEGPVSEPGPPPDLSALDFSLGPLGLHWSLGMPNVDLDSKADENGCGPAAAANSVKWLGVSDHDDVQSLYEDMNTAMNRGDEQRISHADFLNGKLAINFDMGLGLTTKFMGDALPAMDYVDPGNPEHGKAEFKGVTPDFAFIRSELEAGEDVELMMHFSRCRACAFDGNGDMLADFDHEDPCTVDTECDAIMPNDQLGRCVAAGPPCSSNPDCHADSECVLTGGHVVTVTGALDLGLARGLWTKDDKAQTVAGGTQRLFGWLRTWPDGFLDLSSFARNKVAMVVSESPTDPPMGERCASWFDDDGDDLIDCADPECIGGCPPIGRDPAQIRFARGALAGGSHDKFMVHGTIAPPTPIDPANEEVGAILTNATGVVYRAAVAPGALVPKGTHGTRFVYRDRKAQRARCGIAKIELRYRRSKGHYRVRIVGYADLSAATDPNMTLEVKVGDDGFVNTDPWAQTRNGWKLKLPGE